MQPNRSVVDEYTRRQWSSVLRRRDSRVGDRDPRTVARYMTGSVGLHGIRSTIPIRMGKRVEWVPSPLASGIATSLIQEAVSEGLAAAMNRPLDYTPCRCSGTGGRVKHAALGRSRMSCRTDHIPLRCRESSEPTPARSCRRPGGRAAAGGKCVAQRLRDARGRRADQHLLRVQAEVIATDTGCTAAVGEGQHSRGVSSSSPFSCRCGRRA